MKKIMELFYTFLKIGAFTFGGGYAMISIIHRDIVDKKGWLSDEEMTDLLAIAETTPGVIALNSATFVGAKIAGFWGALASSIAVLLPSVIIITLIGGLVEFIKEVKIIQYAFLGIRSAVVALIVNACLKLSKKANKNLFSVIIGFFAFTIAILSSLNLIPIGVEVVILVVAITGIVKGIFDRKKVIKNLLPESESKNCDTDSHTQTTATSNDTINSNKHDLSQSKSETQSKTTAPQTFKDSKVIVNTKNESNREDDK